MKVLVLTDRDWALAKAKIELELHCADTNASLLRGYKKRHQGARPWGEARIRKRHIEAIRLARILTQ